VGYYDPGGAGTGSAPLAEQWNGAKWTFEPDPGQAISGSALFGVSCVSATSCTAVGDEPSTSGQATLAEHWNGLKWVIQPTPNLVGSASYLLGVSCVSATRCIAAGYDSSDPNGGSLALAERWNGTKWSVQGVPNPASAQQSLLSAVSCASATACTAVGYATQRAETVQVTLAERWNGTRWASQAGPGDLGGQEPNVLTAVSCRSGAACTAVGYYENHLFGTPRTLAERWAGARWVLQPTPHPASARSGTLNGVSCASARSCAAVGSYPATRGGHLVNLALAERWNGRKWAIQHIPGPARMSDSSLAAVSCASVRACTAVGRYSVRRHGRTVHLSLAERWNGANWAVQRSPSPAGGSGSSLAGVSCASARACTAVGSHTVKRLGHVVSMSLAERWNGRHWVIEPRPSLPGGSDGSLTAVSCVSARACTAVGNYADTVLATGVPLAERWNGIRWTVQPSPSPAGASDSSLTAVSCASARACVAVGNYQASSSGAGTTLAERWNGQPWVIQPTPNPVVAPGAGQIQLSLPGVSCTSAVACLAVGYYQVTPDEPGIPHTLAERYS
jgi:hypothetical protein